MEYLQDFQSFIKVIYAQNSNFSLLAFISDNFNLSIRCGLGTESVNSILDSVRKIDVSSPAGAGDAAAPAATPAVESAPPVAAAPAQEPPVAAPEAA